MLHILILLGGESRRLFEEEVLSILFPFKRKR